MGVHAIAKGFNIDEVVDNLSRSGIRCHSFTGQFKVELGSFVFRVQLGILVRWVCTALPRYSSMRRQEMMW